MDFNGSLDKVDWIGVIIGFSLPYIFKFLWSILSEKSKNKLRYLHRSIVSRPHPYYDKETNIRKTLETIKNNSTKKDFIIRLGNLSLADNDYTELIKKSIQVEHIWDWHFFLKKDNIEQSYKWLYDFFDIKSNKIIDKKNNSTTELSIVEIAKLWHYRDNFEQYKFDIHFDELIIQGNMRLDDFPEISKLSNRWCDKIEIKEIVIFYAGGSEIRIIKMYHNEIAKSIIDAIVESYDKEKILFIPKDELKQKNKYNNLKKYLNEELLNK